MSPELINPQAFGFENSRPTESSDCYAFGMVIYETISGRLPFHKYTDLTVVVKVLGGERPLREAGFAGGLWDTLELCWMPQPVGRPSVKDVLLCLERTSQSWEEHSLEANGGASNYDDWDSETGSSGKFFSNVVSTFHGLSAFCPPVPFYPHMPLCTQNTQITMACMESSGDRRDGKRRRYQHAANLLFDFCFSPPFVTRLEFFEMFLGPRFQWIHDITCISVY